MIQNVGLSPSPREHDRSIVVSWKLQDNHFSGIFFHEDILLFALLTFRRASLVKVSYNTCGYVSYFIPAVPKQADCHIKVWTIFSWLNILPSQFPCLSGSETTLSTMVQTLYCSLPVISLIWLTSFTHHLLDILFFHTMTNARESCFTWLRGAWSDFLQTNHCVRRTLRKSSA